MSKLRVGDARIMATLRVGDARIMATLRVGDARILVKIVGLTDIHKKNKTNKINSPKNTYKVSF